MQVIGKIIILLLAFSASFGFSILNPGENNKMEKRLKERIDSVYQAYKERNFEKFLNYGTGDYDNRAKKLDEIKKMYPILVDYKIKEIKITGDEAKVKVTITVQLNDVNNVSDSYDYWIFKNNEWHLKDFGKIQ